MTWLYKCQCKGEMERFMIVDNSLPKKTTKPTNQPTKEVSVIRSWSYRNSNEEGVLEPANRVM